MPSCKHLFALGILLGCLPGLSACERPFVEERPPDIEVAGSDFSTIFTEPTASIYVQATSFRRVRRVEVNGQPLTYNAEAGRWESTLQLEPGMNAFAVAAFDETDLASQDTVYAVYLPFRFVQNAPPLPEPRGGHAATLLRNGQLLVTGGAARAGGPAEREAFLLAPGSLSFSPLREGLQTPRTGHTATLLPDGRVLILGGSRTDDVQSVDDLVETAELYDPATRRFETIPVQGPPIRRALHTASIHTIEEGYQVDLFGGRGDIRYGTDPRLGIRSDLRTFLFRNDSLLSRSPGIGFNLSSRDFSVDPIAGHTQSPLAPLAPGERGRYLVAGSYFQGDVVDTETFVMDYTDPQNFVLVSPADPFLVPRTRHAAEQISPGLILMLGGTQGDAAQVLHAAELYADRALQFYRFPDSSTPLKRFSHTATKFFPDRILLVGGFSPDGNATRASEYLLIQTEP